MQTWGALLGFLCVAAMGCVAPVPSDTSDDLSVTHDVGDAQVAQAMAVCASGPTVEGIDVSRFQGTIDWKKVASAGKKFAYIQVARGTSKDAFFEYNWAEAKVNGILRGAYIRFFPEEDLAAQAELLIQGGPYPTGDLPPMLDIEDHANLTPSQLAAKVDELVVRVTSATGRVPVIYTGYYFWKDRVRASRSRMENPLFIANYSASCPLVPEPWNQWLIHQYTSKGKLDAVTVNTVDFNRFNGTLEQLNEWARGATSGTVVPQGGEGTLTGVVYERGRPTSRVQEVRVTLTGQPDQSTRQDGVYAFKLPAGTYTVHFSKPGFHPMSVTRTVKAGQTIWGSVGLTPQAEPMLGPDDSETTVSGFVIHADTQERLPNVQLTLRHSNGETLASTTSDDAGAYTLSAPAAALQGTLLAHAEGFVPVSLPVTREEGVPLVMDVTLEPLDFSALEAHNADGSSSSRPDPVTGCSSVGGFADGFALSLLALGALVSLLRAVE